MSERRRKIFIYAALVLAVLWGLHNFLTLSARKGKVELPKTIQPLAGVPSAPPTASMIDIEEKTKAPWGADPFRTAGTVTVKKAPRPQWRLTGIVYSARTPLAIINNRPVKVGDTIDRAKVVDIGTRTVTVEYQGKLVTLTVSKG